MVRVRANLTLILTLTLPRCSRSPRTAPPCAARS